MRVANAVFLVINIVLLTEGGSRHASRSSINIALLTEGGVAPSLGL